METRLRAIEERLERLEDTSAPDPVTELEVLLVLSMFCYRNDTTYNVDVKNVRESKMAQAEEMRVCLRCSGDEETCKARGCFFRKPLKPEVMKKVTDTLGLPPDIKGLCVRSAIAGRLRVGQALEIPLDSGDVYELIDVVNVGLGDFELPFHVFRRGLVLYFVCPYMPNETIAPKWLSPLYYCCQNGVELLATHVRPEVHQRLVDWLTSNEGCRVVFGGFSLGASVGFMLYRLFRDLYSGLSTRVSYRGAGTKNDMRLDALRDAYHLYLLQVQEGIVYIDRNASLSIHAFPSEFITTEGEKIRDPEALGRLAAPYRVAEATCEGWRETLHDLAPNDRLKTCPEPNPHIGEQGPGAVTQDGLHNLSRYISALTAYLVKQGDARWRNMHTNVAYVVERSL